MNTLRHPLRTPPPLNALRRPCSHALHRTQPSLLHLRPKSLARSSSRLLHTTSPLQTPDRPTVLTNMLASDVPPPVQVSSVSAHGITLADGLVLKGAVVFLEGKVFLWDVPQPSKGVGGVSGWEGWGKEQWGLFEIVVPKPEILIFGTGLRMELVPNSIRAYMKELGIQMDVMDTKNACSTYNLLAEEGRRVAAALLPMEPKGWGRKQGI
ncbi:hypothetical protein HYDPIDRAFT_23022 [Hydnomerulius pinastri MD-312]|nr:hypothetical protein HYDPIDRAFT_23022 [Hydnomerulius pinastri MD-312]